MQTERKKISGNPVCSKTIALILLCCLGIIIYSNTFHSSFHFDDGSFIAGDPGIRNPTHLRVIWSFWPTRFIAYLSLAFNWHLSQSNVFGYHLFNLMVHLGVAILSWWLTLLTFSTPAIKNQKISHPANLIALFVGLIFLAHPIQTQAVTYIIQRATSLTTLFYLAALCLYVKFRLLEQEKITSLALGKFYYLGSLVSAVLAMFTKEIAITLPLAVLLYELCFLKTQKSFNWRQFLPFLFILFIIPLTMFLTKSVNFIDMRRASESVPGISPWHYLLTQFRVIVTYLRLLFLPLKQNLDYDYPIAKSLLQLPVLASFFLLLLLLFTAIRLFSKYRLISFSIFWFFLTLLPESSIIPINDLIFEHRLYLPMFGFSLFLVSTLYYLIGNKRLKLMLTLLCIIVACYSILTFKRNLVWKDELTLWNDTIRKSPQKARPYHNRGNAYKEKGKFDRALSDYNKALAIDPDLAITYANRGITHQNKGNFNQAISDFNKALALDSDLALAYNSRGVIYKSRGNLDLALTDYNKAIAKDPNLASAYVNRGNVYQIKGNLNLALSDYNKAIAIDPDLSSAYNNRGNIYQEKGDIAKAIADFDKVIAGDPNLASAHLNRAIAYQKIGNLDLALSGCSKAIQISPNYAKAFHNRGVIYLLRREYNKSWEDLHKAEALGYKINPRFLEELKKTTGREK